MSNEKEMSALEWLEKNMWEHIEYKPTLEIQRIRKKIQQAKEMEKEQIEEAYKYARAHWSREDGNAERYYEQTYGGNK